MTRSRPTRSPTSIRGQAGPRRDPAAVLATSTFSAGLLLLPHQIQTDAKHLYYMLRTLDDLVDENDPRAEQRVEAVERWAKGAQADTPETRTLARLSRRYALPSDALIEFCQGMRHDLQSKQIETEADLELYCQRVAGTVGIMLATLLGTTHPDGEEKMATLGRAMQRTNILRDIDEDLSHDRTYIARTTIARFGAPIPGAREDLLRDQIHRADALYEDGIGAIPLLRHGSEAMALSTALYREILRQIERDGFGRKPGRATVPTWRKRLIATEQHRPRTSRPHAEPNSELASQPKPARRVPNQ
jgi:phytoene synthase